MIRRFSRFWGQFLPGFLACCGAMGHCLASDPARTAARIDRLLAAEAAAAAGSEQTPALRGVDDETFLRRVFLDLVGSPPTQDEVLSFCLDPNSNKRPLLVSRLLRDDDFGRHWARYWRDVVLYRRTEDRALLVAPQLTDFLAEQFNGNRPWDETVSKLITASGTANEHGQAAFIVAHGAVPEEIAAEVSRIFLGMQIQCAQCHDHPTEPWKREQFHELAAFFPRLGMRVNNADYTITVTTIDVDVPRRRDNNNRIYGTLEHYMPDNDDPGSKGTLMQPVFFLTAEKVEPGERDAQRRAALARWLTDSSNPWFARAFVNRIWTELIGQGFYETVDDLGPKRTCRSPQTLDLLAQEFSRQGSDVKWLFATIMATGAYAQSSDERTTGGSGPGAIVHCAQRLRAEQLLDSLISALHLEGRLPEPPQREGPAALRRDVRFVFSQLFGFDPSVPRDEITATIPQALMLMNSPLLNQAVSAKRRDALGGILARNQDNESALVELYLTAMGRRPTDREIALCLDYVRSVRDRGEAFEDILWSLINSTEFSYRR